MRGILYIFFGLFITSYWACLDVELTEAEIQKSVSEIKGYSKATDSLEKITNKILMNFEKAAYADSLVAATWWKKVREFDLEFDAICAYMQDIQLSLIIRTEGFKNDDRESALNRLHNPNKIKDKPEINTGNVVMIRKGRASSLRRVLIDLKEKALILIKPEDDQMLNDIRDLLNTDDPLMDSYVTTWEYENFEDKPLIVLLARLSYWQNQARKAELITLQYLEAEMR